MKRIPNFRNKVNVSAQDLTVKVSSTQDYKIGLVTWNVAGLFPDNKTEKGLETFFMKRLKGMDFLVVFLQEIVELKMNKNTAVEMAQQTGFTIMGGKKGKGKGKSKGGEATDTED